MYCGIPLGAAMAAVTCIAGYAGNWQLLFQVNGMTPLLILPRLALYLPESNGFRVTATQATGHAGLRHDLLFQGFSPSEFALQIGAATPPLSLGLQMERPPA